MTMRSSGAPPVAVACRRRRRADPSLHSGDDEWEEVHGEEAEAVLMQLDRRQSRGGRAADDAATAQRAGTPDAVMADAADGPAFVSLATNGVELVSLPSICVLVRTQRLTAERLPACRWSAGTCWALASLRATIGSARGPCKTARLWRRPQAQAEGTS